MMSFLTNKRGVSPLVATVLLIAFAVALGAVVMSWSGQVASKISTCGEFSINLETINGQPDVCFSPSDETIYATIINSGAQIQGLSSSVIGSRDVSVEDKPINIGSQEIYKAAISYQARQYGAPKKVSRYALFSKRHRGQ